MTAALQKLWFFRKHDLLENVVSLLTKNIEIPIVEVVICCKDILRNLLF